MPGTSCRAGARPGAGTGKKIELEMRGAETELDRQVLELIKDPLTHMVRNSGRSRAGDAGGPARGRQAGTGRITAERLSTKAATSSSRSPMTGAASRSTGSAKGVSANGLATEAELAAMSDMQIQRLHLPRRLLHRGAGHRVSGRGVGMDVVRTNIEKIGGTIELKSRPGPGHDLHHQDPADAGDRLGADRRMAGERFAIPQISVVELVRARCRAGPRRTPYRAINDTPVLRLRDRCCRWWPGRAAQAEAPAGQARGPSASSW
jgi:two-component system chemotaxis sensor kinase CheA